MKEEDKAMNYVILNGDKVKVLDANCGRCKRISIQEGTEVGLLPRNPIIMECGLTVEYENGIVYDFAILPKIVLEFGYIGCYTDDFEYGVLCNRQLLAAIGRAMADLKDFLKGELEIPEEEESERIIKELDIPYPPISEAEASKTRPKIELEWMLKWRKSGKLCYMQDLGDYEIEESIPDKRKKYIGETGKEVASTAENEEIANMIWMDDGSDDKDVL